MWVNFETEVLQDEPSFHLIDTMFRHFMDKRHHLTQTTMDQLIESEWYQQDPDSKRSQRIKKDVELLYTLNAYDSPKTKISITVTNQESDSTGACLTPKEAWEALNQRAIVLVENSRYDGDAYDVILEAFQQHQLIRTKKSRYWVWDHMGGAGSLEMKLNDIRKNNVGPMRVMVLTDSDRLYGGHLSSLEKQVDKVCSRMSIPYHILEKREIENYLPMPILQRWAGNNKKRRDYLAAFKTLNRQQRDFFDMKLGIPCTTSKDDENKERHLKLYESLSPKDHRTLSKGFGKNIIGLFKTQNDYFDKDMIKKNCPDNPDEMEQIFQKILEIL